MNTLAVSGAASYERNAVDGGAQLVGALFVAVDVGIAESEVVLAGGGGAETVVSGLGAIRALANALGSSRSTVAAGVGDGEGCLDRGRDGS